MEKQITTTRNFLLPMLTFSLALLVFGGGSILYAQSSRAASAKNRLASLIQSDSTYLDAAKVQDAKADFGIYATAQTTTGEYVFLKVVEASMDKGQMPGPALLTLPNGQLATYEGDASIPLIILKDGTRTSGRIIDRLVTFFQLNDGSIISVVLRDAEVRKGALDGLFAGRSVETGYSMAGDIVYGRINEGYVSDIPSFIAEITQALTAILKEEIVLTLVSPSVLAAETDSHQEVSVGTVLGATAVRDRSTGTYKLSGIAEPTLTLASINDVVKQQVNQQVSSQIIQVIRDQPNGALALNFAGSGLITTAEQITDGIIGSVAIADESITTEDIKNGTIKSEDLASGVVGNGDVTGVSAGAGLTGGGNSGDLALAIGGGHGISVSDDTIAVAVATTGGDGSGSSNSGLEVSIAGISLLKGCTDGQVLAWNDGSDLWQCTDAASGGGSGDITAVTAGTGLTGGGTSDAVTLAVAGLTVTHFTSPNISQWTNNAGYITSSTADTLTNKTISAAGNTISGLTNSNLSGAAGITNANLANSSVTITSAGILSGGGTFALGGSLTLTATEADTLASVTGRGATTSTPLNANGGINTTSGGLVLDSAGSLVTVKDNTLFEGSATISGTLALNSDVLGDFTGTGLAIVGGALTVSGLTPSQFASANISQWTNNSGYITASSTDTLTNKTIAAGNNTISGITASNLTAGDFSGVINSGTYGIDISGNAATVTNGVYTGGAGSVFLAPNGNGSALTGLTKSQVGLGSVENTALSTWAGTSNVVTVGTLTSGATGAGFTINFGSSTLSGNVTGANISGVDISSDTNLSASDGVTLTGDALTNSDKGSSQNIFKTVAVAGQSNVVTDTNGDTLTLVAGSNVTLTTDATGDAITLTATDTDTTYSAGSGLSLTGTTFAAAGLTNAHLSGTAGITNANLANSSVTINSAGILSGGGAVALGNSLTLTATEADTLTSITARGATTSTAVNLNGGINTTSGALVLDSAGSLVKFKDNALFEGSATVSGTLAMNGDVLADFTGTGLAISTGALTVSGLTASEFASANISQWTNNAGYITSSTSDTLTNKTISAGSNTITGITNASLANSSVTVNTAGINSGGGAVALGGSITITATEADTLASVTGRGASTAIEMMLNGGINTSGGNALVLDSAGSLIKFKDNARFEGSATISGTLAMGSDVLGDFTGSGLGVSGNALTVSGITATNLSAGDFSSVINSGTYGIDISGNAATVTNGVYTGGAGSVFLAPNGNGSALTGLTKSQVGLGSVENTALSTWAGTANIVTVGTLTSGATGTGFTIDFGSSTLTGNVTGANISGVDVSSDTNLSASDGVTLTGDALTNSDKGSSQNIFKTLAVAGQSNVVTDANSDTVTFIAGTNVTITTDATADSITINAAGGAEGTTYTAGTGLSLTGEEFALDDSYFDGWDQDASDDVTASSTDSFTNKTIDAADNTVTGLDASSLTAGDFSSVVDSGTYSIDITGNALTVTDGVYTGDAGTIFLAPDGDGSALTGLTKAQVGLGSVENTALSSWTGTSNIVTVGTLTTGATGTGFTIDLGNSTLSGNITGANISGVDISSDTNLSASDGVTLTGDALTNSDKGSSQNIFKTIAVSGQSDVVTDANADTLTFAAGTNVTITTTAGTDTVTIAATDTNTTYSAGNDLDLTGTTFDLESTLDIVSTINLAGTGTINGLDAIDNTSESTIETAIDTLGNLTSASALVTVGTLTGGATGTGFTVDFANSTLSGDVTSANISGVDISADTNLSATDGITLTGDQLTLASTTAGDGLTYTTGVLAVGAGTGISVAADAISATLGTSIATAEIDADTIALTAVADTLTLDGASLTLASSDSTNDYKIVFDNSSTGDIATLVQIGTSGSGSTIGVAIDASDTDIATALALGTNDVTVGGATITSAEFALIDSGVALSELTDSGTLTATTVDINGGAIDGVTIGGASAGAGTFTTVTGNTSVSTPTLTLTGTGTINGLDAIDATGETTLEAAIDTLANLTSASALVTVGTLTGGATGTGFTIDFANSTLSGNVTSANISGVDISADTNLSATDGITLTGDQLTLASTTGGAGLTYTTGVLAVGAGNGISAAADAVSVNLTASGTTGSTSSNSGLEVGSGGLALLKGCSDGQLLEWTDAGGWACAADDNSGGATAWNAIADPTAANSITFDNAETSTFVYSATGGDQNAFIFDFNQVDDANATDDFDAMRFDLTSESGDAGDTFDGIVINWENGAANTIMDSAIKIDNAETTASTMTDAIIITSTGVNNGITDAIDVSDSNIANAINIGANAIAGTNFSVTAAGAVTAVTGSVLGSQTFTTNNIADSGALTIKSATTNALTLDSGTTGTVNVGTGTSGKTINVGTDNTTKDTINIGSALDDVAVSSDSWSITNAGALTVASCVGCGGSTTLSLGSDHAISSVTATEVTNLGPITLAAGTYVFRYSIIDTTDTGTVSPAYAVNFTGTAAVRKMTLSYPSTGTTAISGLADDIGATSGQIMESVPVTAFATTAPNMLHTGGQTVTNNVHKFIDGIMIVTVAGDLELWHGSETATQTTLKTGTSVVVTKIGAGSDLAEIYGTRDTSIEPGDVVALDTSLNAGVKKSERAYDRNTFGIISTSPGLTMGSLDDPGTTPVLVAFSGRVPVKVSTENGPIRFGDLLTSSTTPGVAMRATKAGQIVGQAMSEFNPSTGSGQVGKVMAFIKTDYSNGGTLTDLLTSQQLLAQFVGQKEQLVDTGNLSDIIADRVVAGLEIITPKITAEEITTDRLTAGSIVADEITAKHIKADSIEGLDIMAGRISTLSDLYDKLESTTATSAGSVAGVTTKPDSSEFTLATVFKNIVTFVGQVIFHGDVTFLGRPTFNADTAGYAIIKKGSQEVEIHFGRAYREKPIIHTDILVDETDTAKTDAHLKELSDRGIQHVVMNGSTRGFTIRLSHVATEDITFSWAAIAVDNAKTSVSSQQNPEPTPTQAPSIDVTSSPTPTIVQPEVSLTPAITPIPLASPSAIITPAESVDP